MSKASRDKGARFEREVVKLIEKHCFEAKRIGEFKEHDVYANFFGHTKVIECKVRATGASASLLYESLEKAFATFHKKDRGAVLVTMYADEFLEFIREIGSLNYTPGEDL